VRTVRGCTRTERFVPPVLLIRGEFSMKVAVRQLVVVAALAASVLVSASSVVAQPGGGGRGGPGGPGGFMGGPGGGGTLGLIQQQEVRSEIELSEDQQAELETLGQTIRDEMRQEMQGMFEGMRDLSDDERQAKFGEIRSRFEEINKDAEARMQKVLLPHQFDRLKQIDLQSRLQRGGADALSEGELAETLGLTESQREQIREKSEEVQKDLNEKIAQLRVDARKQLLEVLTPEQRAKLESMMGSDFALPEQQFGGRGGRGGRGGQGGRGGFGGRGERGGRGGDGGNGGQTEAAASDNGA
jgi:Spy/CpxP family protein refolding chaperone